MGVVVKNFFSFIVAISVVTSISSASFGTTEIRINSELPAAYYSKFTYGPKVLANSSNKMWSYLTNESMIVLPDGKRASVALFMNQDGSFTLRYIEGQSSGQGSFTFDESKDKIDIKGRWAVNGLNLELEGVGVGTAIQVGTIDIKGKSITIDGIGITFSKDLRSQGLATRPILMVPTLSTHPM